MKYVHVVALLALFSIAAASPASSYAQAIVDKSLLNFLSQPSEPLPGASDPTITAECFNKYLPMLRQVANTFSTEYQDCISVAAQAKNNLTAQSASNRANFIKETTNICSAFETCNNDNNTLTFFNCYATAASSDVSEIYNLSSNATDAATLLTQGLQQIQTHQDECTSAAEHTYVVQTSATYDELNKCFLNGLPDASSSTEAAATTEPETTEAAPTTNAAASSTTASL